MFIRVRRTNIFFSVDAISFMTTIRHLNDIYRLRPTHAYITRLKAKTTYPVLNQFL